MRGSKLSVVVLLLFVLLVPTRSARSNLLIEIQGSSTYEVEVSESTFTVYDSRPSIVDMDLNGDFYFNAADLGLLLINYQHHDSLDLGRLFSAWGSAWHRQDLEGAPEYGWYYLVPSSLKPIVTYDPDGVTSFLLWGQTQSFRTVRTSGNPHDGLHVTLESHERRTYYIKMVSP